MQDVHGVFGVEAAADARLEFGADGLPANLAEAGWSVEYRAWNRESLPMPSKLFARKGAASVRLVIDRWAGP